MFNEPLPEFLLTLTPLTRSFLLNEGLRSLESIAAMRAADLLRLPNFGRRSLREIVNMLALHGLSLAGEPPRPKDRLPEIAAENGWREGDCRRLRRLHAALLQQRQRRDAVKRELELRLARIEARLEEASRAGAALAKGLNLPIGKGESWADAVDRLGLATSIPEGTTY